MNRAGLSSWALRNVPLGVLAWLHGFRFAWLRRRLEQDPETQLLPGLLSPGDVAVDVGANGANWTWFLSRAAGPVGHVLAFEADPYYARATACAVRIMRLRNVTFLPFGLSDCAETVHLKTSNKNGTRLSGCSRVEKGSFQGGGTTLVRLVPLDSLRNIHPELGRTRLIKCDVEGYELFVLRGAEAILRAARPVLIFEIGSFERQGYTAGDLGRWLRERDYDLFALRRDRRLASLDDQLNHPDAATVNRIGLPAERRSEYVDRLPFAEVQP
jgi:FkbM family methyltransferase